MRVVLFLDVTYCVLFTEKLLARSNRQKKTVSPVFWLTNIILPYRADKLQKGVPRIFLILSLAIAQCALSDSGKGANKV